MTKNEIAIFSSLLRMGPLGPARIAKETGLNRPYVYYALERLLEKGYLSTITIAGKRSFQSITPAQIISSQENKIELLKKEIEKIQTFQTMPEEDVNVEVLKGGNVIKNIFKRMLAELISGDEALIIGVDENKMKTIEPVYLNKIFETYKKRRIKERVILKAGSRTLAYAASTKYRFIEPSLIGNTARFIYGKTVIDIVYGSPIYALIIHNSQLADTARKQFEVFWKISKNANRL